ncbi:hypothetical protein OH77DRAFT_1427711 [Trametes cingulata]|nr:hypothetical protein OH77DRAFT_1427711 [Trametes cingulata]
MSTPWSVLVVLCAVLSWTLVQFYFLVISSSCARHSMWTVICMRLVAPGPVCLHTAAWLAVGRSPECADISRSWLPPRRTHTLSWGPLHGRSAARRENGSYGRPVSTPV